MTKKGLYLIFLSFLTIVSAFSQESERIYNKKLIEKKQYTVNIDVNAMALLPNSKLIMGALDIFSLNLVKGELEKIETDKSWFKKEIGYVSSIVYENDTLFVVDKVNRKLLKYDTKNFETISNLKPYIRLSDGVYMGNDNYIITQYRENGKDNWNFQFTVYNTKKDKEIKTYLFKDFFQGDEHYTEECAGFQLEGKFYSNAKYTIYICDKLSKFFVFNSNAEFLYTGNTLFNYPVSKATQRKFLGGETCDLNPDRYVNRSISLYDNIVYVLSNVLDDDIVSMDLYNIEDGSYLESISIPIYNEDEYPKRIFVNNSILFVRYGTSLVSYDIVEK